MSAKQMGMVWDLDVPANQQIVLLALADHASHDGSNVRPAVKLIAWKTGQSESTVRRVMKLLRESGLIEVTRYGKGGKGTPTEYRLNLESGPKKKPYQSGEYPVNLTEYEDPNPVNLTEYPDDNPVKMTGYENDTLSNETLYPVTRVTDKPSIEPVLITESKDSVGPKDLFQSYLDVRNQTWGDFDRKREIPRMIKLARELLESGVTGEDVAGCTIWLEGQRSWRTTPTTFVMVGSKVREWIREGRPGSGGTHTAGKGTGTRGKQSGGAGQDTGFSYDQWVRENPPQWAAGILGVTGGSD